MNTKSPAACNKIAGQRFPEFIPKLWDDTCYSIVKRGVRAELNQEKAIKGNLEYVDAHDLGPIPEWVSGS